MSLPAEEAALYECLSLQVDHLAVHLATPPPSAPAPRHTATSSRVGRGAARPAPHPVFVWPERMMAPAAGGGGGADAGAGEAGVVGVAQLLERAAAAGACPKWGLVELLERFRMEARVQVATWVHPKYPQLRVHLEASPLHVHVSPARLHRVMTVLQAVQPSPPRDGQARAAAAAPVAAASGVPPWLAEAEYKCEVGGCCWGGVALSWCGVLGWWQGGGGHVLVAGTHEPQRPLHHLWAPTVDQTLVVS